MKNSVIFLEQTVKHPDLQFIPITAKKVPIPEGWQHTKKVYDFSQAEGIGLVCGKLSGNVEAIDIDCKYDLTGQLFKNYKKAIAAVDKELLKKLVVQETVSKGFHLIYRCETIQGNLKLAQRAANEAEQAKKDKVKVLIETRGEGGQIAIAPMDGYKVIYGDLSNLATITPDERETLFNTARSFNELVKEFKPTQKQPKKEMPGLSPFEDYNNRGDVIGLMEKHGWKVTGRKGKKVLMLRPGETSAAHSGNFDEGLNWLTVFSTSTEFEPQTSYLPYAVFAYLECNKDFSAASKKLYDLNFGERIEKSAERTQKTASKVDMLDDDFSFLATDDDDDEYLSQWRNGTFPMGLSTGFKSLDPFFLFKPGDLVVVNGHDNTGKSTVIWYLATLSAMFHGWKWVIFSSENKTGAVRKKIIEYYYCESIKTMNQTKYQQARQFVKKYFRIIKTQKNLLNYQDVLNMAEKVNRKEKINGLLIDPYNSLKIEMTDASKFSTHEYHYQAISEIKLWGDNNVISTYVNCHAVTSSLREKTADKLPVAPQKADTEGGGKFPNKADEFITVHRQAQSKTDWMNTELHIRKVKEQETGGRQTFQGEPYIIRAVKGLVGFEHENDDGSIDNPVLEYHKPKDNQAEIFPKERKAQTEYEGVISKDQPDPF